MLKKPLLTALMAVVIAHAPAHADIPDAAQVHPVPVPAAVAPENLFEQASHRVQGLVNSGFQYLGIRYRFGGNSPENGFDCSGLVRKVFMDALGLNLPRTAREMAGMGEEIRRTELKPGDLVFFNTMRRTFSHVGIYLGDNRFLHSPSSGGKVRVDDMSEAYWQKHFNGARRVVGEERSQSALEQAVR